MDFDKIAHVIASDFTNTVGRLPPDGGRLKRAIVKACRAAYDDGFAKGKDVGKLIGDARGQKFARDQITSSPTP